MKIIVVGATGTLGRAVVNELEEDHKIITVGHSNGEVQVDVTDASSIKTMYEQIGNFDSLVAAIGKIQFMGFPEAIDADYRVGINHKLMGQVNLVLLGLPFINSEGSFTLTSGILSEEPIAGSTSAAMVNGALDAFVKCAATDMPNKARINIVSPTVLTESVERFGKLFSGFDSVPGSRVAKAYRKSIEGVQTGQVIKVYQ